MLPTLGEAVLLSVRQTLQESKVPINERKPLYFMDFWFMLSVNMQPVYVI